MAKDTSKIIALRHRLHECAELSMQETETMCVLTDFLRENTALTVVQRDGWFYAVKPGLPGAGSIWQCNNKFKCGCTTPHLEENDIRERVIQVVNRLLGDKMPDKSTVKHRHQ